MYSLPTKPSTQTDTLASALCFELPQDGSAPEWVSAIPAGRADGIDGRVWLNDQPETILQWFHYEQSRNRDIPLDWEHSTEKKAPKGEPAPAAAWIKGMEIRDGEIWCRLEWTQRGRESVTSREYRYISPVFDYIKDSGRIVRITSVGLTNKPNLVLTALNSEEKIMNLSPAIRAALGLTTDASEDQAVAAITTLRTDLGSAQNSALSPSLDHFVPRTDHDQALERASNAEQKLTDIESKNLDADIDSAIGDALTKKKITPATEEFHRAACREEGGLDRFKKYVEVAPEVVSAENLGGKKPPEGEGTAMNAEQQELASIFGNSAEDLEKFGKNS